MSLKYLQKLILLNAHVIGYYFVFTQGKKSLSEYKMNNFFLFALFSSSAICSDLIWTLEHRFRTWLTEQLSYSHLKLKNKVEFFKSNIVQFHLICGWAISVSFLPQSLSFCLKFWFWCFQTWIWTLKPLNSQYHSYLIDN